MDVVKKMGELGMLGMMVPDEYGGAGAGAVSYCLALQEIAYSCASTAVTMSVANLSTEPLLKFGDETQKTNYLVKLAQGELLDVSLLLSQGPDQIRGAFPQRRRTRKTIS